MKEMLKSKGMILFIIMILGVTYTSSLRTQRLEDENSKDYHDMIALSAK